MNFQQLIERNKELIEKIKELDKEIIKAKVLTQSK